MTHFADADAGDGAERRAAQLAAFEAATRDLPGERSICQQRRHAAPRRAPGAGGAATGCGRASCSTARRPTIRCTRAADWGLRRR